MQENSLITDQPLRLSLNAWTVGDPIHKGMISEIHKRLVQNVRGDKADPGNYRRIQNYAANASTREVILHLATAPLKEKKVLRRAF